MSSWISIPPYPNLAGRVNGQLSATFRTADSRSLLNARTPR